MTAGKQAIGNPLEEFAARRGRLGGGRKKPEEAAQAAGQIDGKAETQPGIKEDVQTDSNTDIQKQSGAERPPDSQEVAQSYSVNLIQPDSQTDMKIDGKAETQPGSVTATQPSIKEDVQTDSNTDMQKQSGAERQLDRQTATPLSSYTAGQIGDDTATQRNSYEAVQINSLDPGQIGSNTATQLGSDTGVQTEKPVIDRMKTGYSLDRKLMKEIKILAINENVDVNILIEEALRMLLEARKQT